MSSFLISAHTYSIYLTKLVRLLDTLLCTSRNVTHFPFVTHLARLIRRLAKRKSRRCYALRKRDPGRSAIRALVIRESRTAKEVGYDTFVSKQRWE
jgi:hypothetical protein